jgi:capsular polysaccharide biosynthesis protein
MSEQALDLRGSWHVVVRHRKLVAIFAGLGLLAGAVFTVFNPPAFASRAIIMLSATIHDVSTQVVIAGSDPVLRPAAHDVNPAVSLETLRKRIVATSPTPNLVYIDARGSTASEAEQAANAVAQSYVAYSATLKPAVQASLLQSAGTATQRPLSEQVIEDEVVGALIGLLLGAVIALAISRGDKRLRRRDDIADSIGVPVLASIPVGHPSSPADWTKLLQDYQPNVVHSWRLRNALHYLGLTDVNLADGRDGSGASVAVVSLASDGRALALGPQLAVFAASLGIPTSLVVGPQQDVNVTASLQAACAAPLAPSRRSSRLQVVAAEHGAARQPDAALTVVVVVVDARSPRVAETMPTTATVLGVSAGGASAAELARVALGAAAVGRQITGIVVADPDSADRTTGRIPQLARPVQRKMMPTRLTGTSTKD